MKHWKTITAAALTLVLIGVGFNFIPETDDFGPDEALGAANQATVEVLGGGGGGGVITSSGGGGGGGGEFRAATCTLAVASYTVTVGAGGTIDTTGETDSTFTGSGITITADGGNGSGSATAGTAGTGGSTSGCTSINAFNGGTGGTGNTTGDVGGGGGGGGGWAGKGGNGANGTSGTVGGGGGGGAGETAAGGNASGATAGSGGTGGGGGGGTGGNAAVGGAGTGGSPATWHIVGGGGGGGGDDGLRGGACGAPGAGSGGGEVTGAGNGCRGEIRITYIDDQIAATGGTETTSGIYRTHTFTTSGTFTVSGTAASPYVALNSPANASTTSDTTPELKFTGTASSSDPIRYNVQIDTSSGFDSQTFTNTVIDTYSSANQNAENYLTSFGNATTVGQSFSNTYQGTLKSADFFLKKVGAPTGNLTVTVHAHTGTYGINSNRTGPQLATSTPLDVSTLTTSFALTNLTFTGGNQITLNADTKYVIGLNYPGGDTSNYVAFGVDTTVPSHGGNTINSNHNPTPDTDMIFSVYTDYGSPLTDVVSGVLSTSKTVTNNAATGTTAWTNTGNIASSDNAYVQVSNSGGTRLTSQYLQSSAHGFAIPTNAVITGIQVTYERSSVEYAAGTGDVGMFVVKADGTLGSTNKAVSGTWGATDTLYSYGSSTDLWGETWTAADINDSDFGFALATTFGPPSVVNSIQYIDTMYVTVWYQGFSGSPDNLDPFASAQEVTYTVQSALSDATYYWRVRGIDLDGTNAYGPWSDTRSLTIASGGGGGGGGEPMRIEDVYFLQ